MSSNYMRVSHGLAIAAWGPRPAGADGREMYASGTWFERPHLTIPEYPTATV